MFVYYSKSVKCGRHYTDSSIMSDFEMCEIHVDICIYAY